ncbi:MAG: ABC transporter permease [Lachnospiraceae bacterium]|nr:ABC transporter permease [Lachnospiraceae bacterium]
MRYALKKFVTMVITIIMVTLFVFLAFNLISGDPVISILGTDATPERVEALRRELHLDDPVILRYFRWFFNFMRGDMGVSYSYKINVRSMILEKVPVTATMAIMAFFLMIIIAIPLGIHTSKHQGSALDRTVIILNQIIMSIPPFFSGILLTFIFGRVLKLFTPGGYVSYQKDFGSFLWYMFFPSLAIALPKATMAIKLLRGSLISEYNMDYVRTAYSKGNSTNGVLYGHMLKNAILPVITFLGMALTDMIAGSIIVEQVFSIPGLGRILLTSISNRDYPVVLAIIVIISAMVLLVNMLIDIIYSLIDPRISFEE